MEPSKHTEKASTSKVAHDFKSDKTEENVLARGNNESEKLKTKSQDDSQVESDCLDEQSQEKAEDLEDNTQPDSAKKNEEDQSSKAAQEKGKNSEEDYKSKYFYIAAEMENMRKRFSKEKEGLIKYGNQKILTDLLDVIDNFERTISAIEQDEDEKVKNIVIGINMVNGLFCDVLKKYGLVQVKALGEIFDPNVHEAVSQKVVEGKKEDEIVEEYQKGYLLNGRLVRPAKVVVARPE